MEHYTTKKKHHSVAKTQRHSQTKAFHQPRKPNIKGPRDPLVESIIKHTRSRPQSSLAHLNYGIKLFSIHRPRSKAPANTMKEPTLDQTLACIDPMTVDNYDDLTLHLTNILEEARNAIDHREISKHRLRLENFVPDAQKALNQIEHECTQDATKCEFWVGRLWVLIWTILGHPRDTVESSESEPHGERMYRYVRNNTLNHLERIIHLRREMRDTSVSVAVPELINKWRDLFNDIAFGIEDTLNPYIRHYLGMSLPDEWTERVWLPHKWSSTKHYRSQGNLEDPLDERILVSLPETLEIHASAKADTRDDA